MRGDPTTEAICMTLATTWQVVRDSTGYYRAMQDSYVLQEHNQEESIAQGLTYRDASKLAGELYDVEEVMGS